MSVVDTTLTCPNCGRQATAQIVYDDPGRAAVIRDYDCPNGCAVDEESLRQIVGTSDN